MLVSEGVLKWAMRCYPPLLFQRVLVTKFHKGFRGVDVKVKKSFFNNNYNGSIFGGTIFSAADPFYPVLFYQVLIRRGYKIMAWSQSAAIRFRKPAHTSLYFKINITDENITDCERDLNSTGIHRRTFPIEIYDKSGQLCATVLIKIYIRNLNYMKVDQVSF
jgi:hypothetical protein